MRTLYNVFLALSRFQALRCTCEDGRIFSMFDEDKTKEELKAELKELRRQLSEARLKQKQLEEALRLSEDRFRAFMDNSPSTAWMKDEHGRYVYLSASGERSFGIAPGDCIGKTDFELFTPEKARRFRDNDLTVLKSCRVLEIVEESIEPDGSPCTWWKFKFPFKDAAGKRYVGGIGLDISERRRMEEDLRKTSGELEVRVRNRTEELEKANKELRQIPSRLIAAQEEERRRIGSELHDSLAQTLAALKYWVEMIILLKNSGNREDALDRLEQFIPIIQRSIEETRAIYMGLKPTVLEEFGIVATLRWCCREFQDLYPAPHVELETVVDEEDIPAPLKTVIFRIAQEGLSNIARHSKAEWVDIRLVRKDHDIELTIADDGIGFDPAAVLHHAFARSIGLTGMRERTELMGGTFSIESGPGEGTTLKAGWPLKYDENETSALPYAGGP